jgi:hypothetical protein
VIRFLKLLFFIPATLAMLPACTPAEPREKPVITVDDVDIFSSGVRAIIRTTGQVDLNKDPRIVCEERIPIGSHLTKMVCMTREEMATLKKESEDAIFEVQEAQQHLEEIHP